ncbi:VOC family protein [Actinomadura barringtoniae]|uniref:VOC family protein n=1 Tax=Actinomadura barringtoniae TaxID=1427535 RepID=A0A939PL57_9ACTN|nr:VOC family protein [Actinomadura barringtoniae]MBO2451904.1 VOC family protein [Actinomadura barringtoniae]
MSGPAFDSVAWFQVGTTDPDAARTFYGRLFGWSFQADPNVGGGYDLVTAKGSEGPSGGLATVADPAQNHAIFMVVVRDVATAVKQTEELGGKVVVPPKTTDDGLVFAHLLDPAGNEFGVFTPPATDGTKPVEA